MVQIIDMSPLMMVNELRKEKEIVELINATVSHEMRTPINSITHECR